MKTLAIIGGGAAGLMAAINAAAFARQHNESLQVEVYEADAERIGRSILATGNGRCNFSNENPCSSSYYNAEFVQSVFGVLESLLKLNMVDDDPINPVHAQFEQLGLCWQVQGEGRMYPMSNKAATVLNVLRQALQRFGVALHVNKRCERIDASANGTGVYNIRFADGCVVHTNAVVVCVGGRAIEGVQLPSNIARKKTREVLGPLAVSEQGRKITRTLNNIRVRCVASLVQKTAAGYKRLASESGELLFRNYGVSGVCVFNLSRFVKPNCQVRINLLPNIPANDVTNFLHARFSMLEQTFGGNITGKQFCEGMLLPQVAAAVFAQAGLSASADLKASHLKKLASAMTQLTFDVEDVYIKQQCQVHRGGLDTACFKSNCEAQSLHGFFAAGEALDVDGPCGGFNLHWAWASGMVAGISAALSLVYGV